MPRPHDEREQISDFTDTERLVVETTVMERFGKRVDVQVADAETRMHSGDHELTEVPVLYWNERDQFFYSVKDQFGTGREEYDDIGDCVLTLLRIQADHESMRDKQ